MSITFRIGDLAKHAGVKVVTIRYYEQSGMLPACERTAGNYRVYAQEQIRDLLLLSTSKSPTCADVCGIAADHLKEVESRITDLKRLASELRRIGSSCNGKRPSAECRIIASLTNA
jgi:predicted site-specific integrase-resolvase